ncbi:MAG: hypothetical protein H0X21_02410 [Actinobacteria bacterium]|nr:hypothetical protein [Actinomycetota bacterium]
MSQNEPGLELHGWETRWQELETTFEEDPAGALPEACDFVEQTLRESELDPESTTAEPGELQSAYAAARETANRIERGEDVDPGDIGAAIENLRAVYDTLRATRPG